MVVGDGVVVEVCTKVRGAVMVTSIMNEGTYFRVFGGMLLIGGNKRVRVIIPPDVLPTVKVHVKIVSFSDFIV